VFERLIGVSGIGPKLALAVLSGIEPRELVGAIERGDLCAADPHSRGRQEDGGADVRGTARPDAQGDGRDGGDAAPVRGMRRGATIWPRRSSISATIDARWTR
jgi:hypothetical protein